MKRKQKKPGALPSMEAVITGGSLHAVLPRLHVQEIKKHVVVLTIGPQILYLEAGDSINLAVVLHGRTGGWPNS